MGRFYWKKLSSKTKLCLLGPKKTTVGSVSCFRNTTVGLNRPTRRQTCPFPKSSQSHTSTVCVRMLFLGEFKLWEKGKTSPYICPFIEKKIKIINMNIGRTKLTKWKFDLKKIETGWYNNNNSSILLLVNQKKSKSNLPPLTSNNVINLSIIWILCFACVPICLYVKCCFLVSFFFQGRKLIKRRSREEQEGETKK